MTRISSPPNFCSATGVGPRITGRLSLVWCLCALLVGVVACEEREPTTQSDPSPGVGAGPQGSNRTPEPSGDATGGKIVQVDGETPSPDTVLAKAGSHQVTLEEYERYLQRSLLFAPGESGDRPEQISARRKASPKYQHQALRTLLRKKVIRAEAERRGLEVDEDERVEFLKNHDELARYASALDGGGDDLDLPEGLDADDLRSIADYYLLEAKLRRDLVSVPDDDELWELWKRRNNRISLAYVGLDNSPKPSEIDSFLTIDRQRDWKRIREHYEAHPDEYARPPMVELAIVRPAPRQSPDRSKLERAAELLGEGKSVSKVADEFGWRPDPGTWLVSRENKEAFEADVGATGIERDGPRGTYAWRVEGRRGGQQRKLNASLRREIAADLLSQDMVDSVEKGARRALETMEKIGGDQFPLEGETREKLEKKFEKFGIPLKTTGFFPRDTNGRIPGIGLAEKVAERAAELTKEDPVVDDPVLSRDRVFAFRLLNRDGTSRSQFKTKRKTFRQKILDRRRKRALDEFFMGWLDEHDPQFTLRPLHVEYGRLEKK